MKQTRAKLKTLLVLWAFGYSALVSASAADMLLEDHDLVDHIYDVTNDRFISRQQLDNRLAQVDFVLLGESHDNLRHHVIQTELIDVLAQRQGTVSVVFEMIDTRQGDAIKNQSFDSAAALIEALEPRGAGWQYETYYAGLFDAVIAADMTIRPGNVDRQALMNMVRGSESLDTDIEKLLDQVTLDEKNLRDEIAASHCHLLDNEMIAPMVNAQRIRDAFMTLSLVRADADIRVLVAGNGHVRTDRGVPLYLRQWHSPGEQPEILTVTALEVREDARHPRQYSSDWGADVLPFDYVWFTPRAERQNPCEEMEQHMKRKTGDDAG